MLLTSLALLTASTAPHTDYPQCTAALDRALSQAKFARYPATTAPFRTVPPDVRRGWARTYRTVTRAEAIRGPDFAGHYTIVQAGCGAATSCLAILDQRTGRVHQPPALRIASYALIDVGRTDYEKLNYRRDSRLLVLVGVANEREGTKGISYYLWKSDRLRLLRRMPFKHVCPDAKEQW